MIGYLKGRLLNVYDEHLLLDVHGVGYRVFVSQRQIHALPPIGHETAFHIASIVREDAFLLYGFPNHFELKIFNLLIGVSGIGPRQAINMLSNSRPEVLAQSIIAMDSGLLKSIRGVGQKTAEKVILELKTPMAKLLEQEALPPRLPNETPFKSDLVAALLQLGYRRQQIEETLFQLPLEEYKTVQQAIREALKQLSGAKATSGVRENS